MAGPCLDWSSGVITPFYTVTSSLLIDTVPDCSQQGYVQRYNTSKHSLHRLPHHSIDGRDIYFFNFALRLIIKLKASMAELCLMVHQCGSLCPTLSQSIFHWWTQGAWQVCIMLSVGRDCYISSTFGIIKSLTFYSPCVQLHALISICTHVKNPKPLFGNKNAAHADRNR